MYGGTPREVGCAAKERTPFEWGLSPFGSLMLDRQTSVSGKATRVPRTQRARVASDSYGKDCKGLGAHSGRGLSVAMVLASSNVVVHGLDSERPQDFTNIGMG